MLCYQIGWIEKVKINKEPLIRLQNKNISIISFIYISALVTSYSKSCHILKHNLIIVLKKNIDVKKAKLLIDVIINRKKHISIN